MRIESLKISVPAWLLIVVVGVAICIGASVWYYLLDADSPKMIGLVGGVVSGLLVFVLTFVVSIQPLLKLDRFEKMGIRNVLQNRHDKAYYAKVLVKARKTIKVTGASCTRFVDDFLDMENEDRLLISALQKYDRLQIQLLMPDDTHVSDEARARLPSMFRKLDRVRENFGQRVQVRRFCGPAHHSFIIADEELVAGPIFQGDKSKYAPAVHVAMFTKFGEKYDEYFDLVWNSCE